ncbi:MAG: DUF4190 domain-containing protein [Sandaracinaceae bacterium]|nr:DUF4190 domain-containing protein [Sandaracinaceae bacterium]
MTPGALCAAHPSAAAVDTCARCGNYVCSNCMEVEEWDTYCPDCYARVGKKAPASSLATTALVLALLSISGCLPLALPAAILGHMELGKIERGESEPGGRNLAQGAVYVGWIVTALSALLVLGILMVAILGASV